MARKELVMSEHPFWQTVLHESGVGPKVVEIEVTTKAEINGRTARKEIALFDAIHAEILGEKDAEKAKVRRNRKQKRNHKAEELRSEKEKRKMKNIRTFGKSDFPEDHVRYIDVKYCGGGTKAWFGRDEDPTIRMRKIAEAEKFAWKDYEDEKWWAEYDAEIAEYERKRKAEDLKAHIEHMNNLWRWLEWA